MKNDKRKAERRNMRHRALVVGPDNAPVADCMISDVSATGAQLNLTASVELPDQFDLILAKGGAVRRPCTVIWRDANHVGVRFRDAPRPT